MAAGQTEMLPGILLDILKFGGINNTPTGNIAIPTADGSTVYYSNSFPLPRGGTFGWELQFTSSGTVACTVELEHGNQRPATEGAADTAWAIPDNKLTTNRLWPAAADTNVHFFAYSPDATAFGRLKITGNSTNNAATALSKARMYRIKNN